MFIYKFTLNLIAIIRSRLFVVMKISLLSFSSLIIFWGYFAIVTSTGSNIMKTPTKSPSKNYLRHRHASGGVSKYFPKRGSPLKKTIYKEQEDGLTARVKEAIHKFAKKIDKGVTGFSTEAKSEISGENCVSKEAGN